MSNPAPKDGFGLARTRRTLPMALLRAREAVMENFRPLLAENDVTEQQWRVMRVLEEVEEADASFVAQNASILAPSLTRIMRSLEKRGFVSLSRDTKDGRRTLMRLTQEGSEFIHAITPKSAKIYAEIEQKIGAERIAALLNEVEYLLDKLEE